MLQVVPKYSKSDKPTALIYKTVLRNCNKNDPFKQGSSTANFHKAVSSASLTSPHNHWYCIRCIHDFKIRGWFSSLDEQTDLKINDVVGLELYVETTEGGRATRDISHPPLYGTVDIYLVHSHDLFLRDTIDAKGHQGVKGDTSKKINQREMKYNQ